MVVIDEGDVVHYGILRRSGRYPWGSGGNAEQRSKRFLDWLAVLRGKGLTEKQIAEGVGLSTTQLRAANSIAQESARAADISMAIGLKNKGYSNVAIGERMGVPESTVRNWLAPGAAERTSSIVATANALRDQVEQHGVIDVGRGAERYLGISDTKLRTALAVLEDEGYNIHALKINQLGTEHETRLKVLTKPEITQKEVWQNPDMVTQLATYSDDGGRTYLGLKEPLSVDPARVGVVYAEDGGAQADGVIYVRPGVDDVSLGGAAYAQVRIKVGDGHYLKGMAVYSDNLPDGVDLMFNTNKKKTDVESDLDAFKKLSDDPDNPFGAVIRRQIVADPSDPNSPLTSAVNLVNEEGNWGDWSKSISSQVLSKQSPKVAQRQLDVSLRRKQEEFDEIMELTNPTVRKKLLAEFADGADAASVHLKAAGFPRQGWHVILPVNDMKPNEVYAPNFIDGEEVVLIRYPHGGTFEIPELTVNNRQSSARRTLGRNPVDAIGIHSSVAERLSGADFDGDTVLVIPRRNADIKSTRALDGLKDFDPRTEYAGFPGMRTMTNTQTEMGKISNLITDMTIKGASPNELARAVRHSMVVIDAEKHGLNYRLSAERNGIKNLVEKYQTDPETGTKGASTIVSRAKSRVYVDERREARVSEGGPIDPVTGRKRYVPTGRTKADGSPRQQRSEALAETDDAFTLSSGTRIENQYAQYSNDLKALANRARREYVSTPRLEYSKSARRTYATEVAELDAALDIAIRNAPLERQAQILAQTYVRARVQDNPGMDRDTRRKIESQALAEARTRTGARKQRIEITPSQWEAIQAGAISDSKLSSILDNADMDIVRGLATPRTQLLMTPSKTNRARTLLAAGHTRADVAQQLGVSLTTLDESIGGGS